MITSVAEPAVAKGTAGEVLRAFLYPGLTSFGGPIAHLGYFRVELVTRRRWTDEAGYGALPFWEAVRIQPDAQAVLRGTNAAVVGILAAALYDLVPTSSVAGLADIAIAGAGFVALLSGVRPWAVVIAVTATTLAFIPF